jgi:serine/threonine protein kinase
VRFFGITQDPINLNYIVVMSYVKEGSLRKCLPNIINFNWHNKLKLLKKIILGLKVIHESGLIHCDLHDGNILISNNEIYIIDLGLCKPISNSLQNSKNIYGVLPYMAPEVLRSKPYIPASDIYSFSMIMWEFTSGTPPFGDRVLDHHLSLSICKGERPEIVENTPSYYIDLMKQCWDPEPFKRPTIKTLENTISEWLSCFDKYDMNGGFFRVVHDEYNIDNSQISSIMREFAKDLVQRQANTSTMQSHPQAYYKSRLLEKVNETSDKEVIFSSKSECLDCEIKS